MSIRLTRSIAVLGACAAIAACAKKESSTDTTVVKTDTSAAAAAATTPAPLTDANIAALLDEANAADSANGNLASTKGTNASIKDFGRMMMRDHHSLRKQGQDLAKKLNLTPQAPSNDTLPAAAQKMGDSLKAQAKGAAWDQAYINNEVAVHQSVLSLLQTAQGAAQDTSLKALITKAIPNVQAHLTKAQDIQGKLGNAAADTANKAKKP